MPTQHPETPADRLAWARLWAVVTGPWERLADLAAILGVGRTTVLEWGPEGRHVGSGPWPMLRQALRRTARAYPAEVPRLVQALAAELLDVEGTWSPLGAPTADYRDESDDVVDALAELTRAVRAGGDPGTIRRLADRLVREANEAAAAAHASAK
jgi:hypothetical protein